MLSRCFRFTSWAVSRAHDSLGRTTVVTRLEVLLIGEQDERDTILRKGEKPVNDAGLTLIDLGGSGYARVDTPVLERRYGKTWVQICARERRHGFTRRGICMIDGRYGIWRGGIGVVDRLLHRPSIATRDIDFAHGFAMGGGVFCRMWRWN
jgi:hypothetical protein